MAEPTSITLTKGEIDNIIATVPKMSYGEIGLVRGRYRAFDNLVRSKLPPGYHWYPREVVRLKNGDAVVPIKRHIQYFIDPCHFDVLKLLDEVPAEWGGSNIVTPETERAFNLACGHGEISQQV